MGNKGILFVVSGPSGVGKGTIIASVRQQLKDLHLSVSATTRLPREGEIEGKNYFFIQEPDFQNMIENDQLLEWAKVYSHYYGTPKQYVFEHLFAGQNVVMEIDTQGALQVKEKLPQGVFVFIAPPSIEDLEQRITKRGTDSAESIQARLEACQYEMQQMKYYDYIVINQDLLVAVEKLKAIIMAEQCRCCYYDYYGGIQF